jgi:hypothetical protein
MMSFIDKQIGTMFRHSDLNFFIALACNMCGSDDDIASLEESISLSRIPWFMFKNTDYRIARALRDDAKVFQYPQCEEFIGNLCPECITRYNHEENRQKPAADTQIFNCVNRVAGFTSDAAAISRNEFGIAQPPVIYYAYSNMRPVTVQKYRLLSYLCDILTRPCIVILDCVQQRIVDNRLGDVISNAHAINLVRDFRFGGNDHHRNGGKYRLLYLQLAKLFPIHYRHIQIKQYQPNGVRVASEDHESFGSICRTDHLIAFIVKYIR